jgi:hypothetical protein
MKRRVIFAGIVFVTISLCAVRAQQPIVGGYSEAAVTEKAVTDAADFAIGAQQKAMQDSKGDKAIKLELVKITKAQQQVVAGMNYRLKLLVKVNGREQQAEAVVWWQAWRKPDPYQLTSWKWIDR